MFIIKSHGIEQRFNSKVEALCAAATLKAFGYDAEVYQKIQVKYVYL